MCHGDIRSPFSSDRARLIDLSPTDNASGFKATAPTAFGVKTEPCESKRCLWETQHRSVGHNVILSRELSFVCVPAIERRRHRDHRDHRQSMNRSEGDKRACEGLKVHKAFLLCLFFFLPFFLFQEQRERLNTTETQPGTVVVRHRTGL